MEDLLKLPEFTWDEIQEHTDEQSCWCVIYGLVYDLTKFLNVHPGTAHVLLEVAGTDATEAFEESSHSLQARVQADEFIIGRLKGATDLRKCSAARGSACCSSQRKAEKLSGSPLSLIITMALVALVGIWLYYHSQEDDGSKYHAAAPMKPDSVDESATYMSY
ncbi:hypothetical protein Efla_000026 [Eimeria flavescens]